jgi:hypothetical protein
MKRQIWVERADIFTWKSRYLKEVQEYSDDGHLIFYMHKTWPDSNLTFHSCWQEDEVIGIRTHVNSGNRLIMVHVGGTGGLLPMSTSHLQGWT